MGRQSWVIPFNRIVCSIYEPMIIMLVIGTKRLLANKEVKIRSIPSM